MFPTELHITVTQDHIDNGTTQDCERCPIALAVLDCISNPGTVAVDSDEIQLDYQDHHAVYDMPTKAMNFIADFDAGYHVQPFTFTATERYRFPTYR